MYQLNSRINEQRQRSVFQFRDATPAETAALIQDMDTRKELGIIPASDILYPRGVSPMVTPVGPVLTCNMEGSQDSHINHCDLRVITPCAPCKRNGGKK